MDELRHLQRHVKDLEKQLADEAAARQEAERERARFRQALDAFDDGLVLFDDKGRLAYCNPKYREFFRGAADCLVPGATWKETRKAVLETGEITGDSRDRWPAKIPGGQSDPFLIELADGQCLRAYHHRTDDGGLAGIYTDVTDLRPERRGSDTAAADDKARFRALFQDAPVAMHVKDTAFRFQAVNASFETRHGVPAERLIGARAGDITEWAQTNEAMDRRVLETGTPLTLERPTAKADGTNGISITTKYPIRGADGEIVSIAGVSVDVSAFKELERQLLDKTHLLETTVRSVEQGFAVMDPDLRVLICNRKFLTLHHYAGDFPEGGLPLHDILVEFAKTGIYGSGDQEKLIRKRLDRLRHADRPEQEERRQPNGRILDVRRVSLPGGGYVVTYTDITDLKRAEETAVSARRLLREILDALPASVAFYDADQKLLFCNTATRDLYNWQTELHRPGVTYEAQLRDSIAKKMLPEAVGREADWLREHMSRFNSSAQDIETQRPGGRWHLSSFRRTSDGGTVVIRFDITARKQAEKALRASEENFRDLIENSTLGISISRYGKLMFVNQALADIFGFGTPDELLQIGSLKDVAAPHELPRMTQYGRDRLVGRAVPSVYEFEAIRQDGEPIWVQRSARVVTWQGIRAIQSTMIDVTDRHNAESKLRAALNAAEAANRAKSDFLAKMSHELRTPLNAIIGFSEVLGRETFGPLGSPKYKDYVADIAVSGNHLLDMITDILDMSKIEAGSFELSPAEIDMQKTVREIVRVVSGQLERQGLTLNLDLADDGETLYADPRATRQILLNLLSNAIKFTEAGGSITVGTHRFDGGKLRLTITDTGIGIAEADIERVLQPFSQVGSAQTNAQTGTGLGLPIVKSLVELHGGVMEIQSEPDRGTTVIVEFPNSSAETVPVQAS
ncbi:MAG: PAS-domain containing protein [Alphaproteobacteria bacterium]|nr:PAS-domain containing protein [Alphaproteobacteria bacterium]